jgi:phosphinothricin acetyltransferase
MSEPHIRTATLADIAAITRIYADAVTRGTATFEIDPPDEAEMARRLQALLANGCPCLVAERGGAVAGYAYAGRYHVRAAYRWTAEDSIYIAPALHRHGLGRLLITHLIAEAQARGFRQMIALIGDSANTASIALHANAGFRHAGTLSSVGYKRGRWLDVVMMQLPLGGADATAPFL